MLKTSQIIKIDSSKGENYNEFLTSFNYKLSDSIDCDNNEVIKYNLISCSIPYSFYAVNSYNDMLDLIEICNGITVHRSIRVEHGNYSTTEFMKQIMLELNANNVNRLIYTITYLKASNKYTISIINGGAVMLFKTGANAKRSINRFLGFSNDDDVTISPTHTVISDQCVIMSDIYYLQLRTDLGSQTMLMSDGSDYILEIIPISSQPYGFIQHIPVQRHQYNLSHRSLNSIKIELIDNNNHILDLNNIPFIIMLNVEIWHEHNIYDDPREHDKTNLQIFDENPYLLDKQIVTTQPNLEEYNNYTNFMQLQKYIKKLKSNTNVRNAKRKEGQSKKG